MIFNKTKFLPYAAPWQVQDLKANLLDIHNQRLWWFMNVNDNFVSFDHASPYLFSSNILLPNRWLYSALRHAFLRSQWFSCCSRHGGHHYQSTGVHNCTNIERSGGFAIFLHFLCIMPQRPLWSSNVQSKTWVCFLCFKVVKSAVNFLLGALLKDYQQSGSDGSKSPLSLYLLFTFGWDIGIQILWPTRLRCFLANGNRFECADSPLSNTNMHHFWQVEFAVTFSTRILEYHCESDLLRTNHINTRTFTNNVFFSLPISWRSNCTFFKYLQYSHTTELSSPTFHRIAHDKKMSLLTSTTNIHGTTSGNFAAGLLEFYIVDLE